MRDAPPSAFPSSARRTAGVVGPNAVIQLARALDAQTGPQTASDIFAIAGYADLYGHAGSDPVLRQVIDAHRP